MQASGTLKNTVITQEKVCVTESKFGQIRREETELTARQWSINLDKMKMEVWSHPLPPVLEEINLRLLLQT